MKIRKSDNVYILSGKDKGKTGVVEAAFPKADKIIVKGIALVKKHIKPSKKHPQGGIIEINQKIDASNVMIVCSACGKFTKVGYSISEDGLKTRTCKKCGQNLGAGDNN